MTLWAIALMAFVGFVYWRPEVLLRPADLRPLEDKSDEWRYLEPLNDTNQQRPGQFDAGSLRSKINRWRNSVQLRSRESIALSVREEGLSDYNYAPTSARPVSHLQRISEDEQQLEFGNTHKSPRDHVSDGTERQLEARRHAQIATLEIPSR